MKFQIDTRKQTGKKRVKFTASQRCPCCHSSSWTFHIRCRPSRFFLQHRNRERAPPKLFSLSSRSSVVLRFFRGFPTFSPDFWCGNATVNTFVLPFFHCGEISFCVHYDDESENVHEIWCGVRGF